MITIEKYNYKMLNIWDDFISKSNNGTIFNKQTFLSYHISRKFKDHSLLFYLKNKLLCVLPAAHIKKNNQEILCSHPGASFGGLICLENIKFSTYDLVLKSLVDYSKKHGFDSILLINTPSIYSRVQDGSLNYLLLWNCFYPYENYISHFVDISKNKTIDELLSKRKQRYIRQLIDQKMFTIKSSDNLNCFYEILLDSKKTFNSQPTHSLKELKKLTSLLPNNIELLLSETDGEISGGALVFYTNTASCLVFYNVIKLKYQSSQLATLQLYYCMQRAKQHGCKIIDFGVSHTPENNNPLKPKKSLIKFKEQFGARGVLRTVYKWKLND